MDINDLTWNPVDMEAEIQKIYDRKERLQALRKA